MEFEAQVIAAYGRHVRVRDDTGRIVQARPFGRRLQVVCGDRVRGNEDATHAEVHVTEILPRRTLLARATLRGDPEPVVANLSLLVAVMAPAPTPDLFIIDRYLCAASSAGIKALVLVNKCDLGPDVDPSVLTQSFETAGYPILQCSAETGRGLETLNEFLRHETSVFVGQSGVGKSSIIGRLMPGVVLATGELDRDAEGRHTTTSSSLHDLPDGGHVIDSPGVRDFAPSVDSLESRSLGFPEVDQLSTGCRFSDCQHLQEPGCAVRTAAEGGQIDKRRYESYRRLRRLHADLTAARGLGRKRS